MWLGILLVVLWIGLAWVVFYDLRDLARLLRLAREYSSEPSLSAPADRPTVDVVIPIYNMGDSVGETLSSIERSSYQARQVIVVDDGSTDGRTWPALQALAERIDVLAQIEHGGKAAAANHGARLGEGEVLLFLDADSYVSEDFIERTLAVFEAHPEVGAIDYVQRVSNPEESFWTRQATFERALLALQPDNFGALFAMRREVFEGFPFRDGLSPQFDINARLRQAGLLRIDPQALVFSEEPRDLGLTFRRKRRWTYGFLEAQARQGRGLDYHLLVPFADLAFLATLPLALLWPALLPFAPVLYAVWTVKSLLLAKPLGLSRRDALGYGVYMAVVNAAVAAGTIAFRAKRQVVWR
ncbi:MAG: glycosyltransferase family 2 protein [Pseudomonadota bacterium]